MGCDFEPKTGPKARRHKIDLALSPNLRKRYSSQDLSEEAPSFSEISACPRPLALFSFRFFKKLRDRLCEIKWPIFLKIFQKFSKIAKSSSEILCPKPAGETLGLFWEKGPNNRHLTCFCDVAVENHDFAQHRREGLGKMIFPLRYKIEFSMCFSKDWANLCPKPVGPVGGLAGRRRCLILHT